MTQLHHDDNHLFIVDPGDDPPVPGAKTPVARELPYESMAAQARIVEQSDFLQEP